jgi:Fe-S-cluster-containing hydrogenase component 2
MRKIILPSYERCTGCRQCELVCSVKKTGKSAPSRARISIVKWEGEGLFFPMICSQCEEPFCMKVCPKKAIEKDEKLGHVIINYEICIGCHLCVIVCPFGGMGIDEVEGKVIKCDLCEGEPICVRFCKREALEYVERTEVTLRKKRILLEKLIPIIRKIYD